VLEGEARVLDSVFQDSVVEHREGLAGTRESISTKWSIGLIELELKICKRRWISFQANTQ